MCGGGPSSGGAGAGGAGASGRLGGPDFAAVLLRGGAGGTALVLVAPPAVTADALALAMAL